MVCEPGDVSLGYDVFVCPKCSTKFLVHHTTPDSKDDRLVARFANVRYWHLADIG